MDKHLKNVLQQNQNNYILPFLWVHGEGEAILREEIGRIYESGIGAICVESRPHPDFTGPIWWRDMDIIMEEAKKRQMKVWLLDDAHFPTGYANGWIKDKFPEKGKRYLSEYHIDACGPLDNASFILDRSKDKDFFNPDFESAADDQILSIVAVKRKSIGEGFDEVIFDLTEKITDGMLYWDVPEGIWTIFILIITRSGGGDPDYINVIDKESVKVLIDAVYEPHYAHYGDEFGKTFAGFFSDEPGFGNSIGYAFDESIGRKKMTLPWSDDVKELLEKELGCDYREYLICLWEDLGSRTSNVRYQYMDIITKLYEKNFSRQLGDWCRNRNVEYIGHVIEDQNVNTRLGCGAGHFFRALYGQDMSGLDVVLQQIMPGFDTTYHDWIGGRWDGEFFHFALAKLGSSLGHIDSLKKGRTMCEIYGAYGWMEGIKLMKWLTDHMLVRGVNWFVPHAFSPKEFPDPDCPPHFFARGRNPQYRYFKELMQYTNRVCHLLNDGIHIAPVAILYHAEAEWSGDYMLFQKPARVLAQNQIDYDILPSDVFANPNLFNTKLSEGKLWVNNEKYSCLIIPYSQNVTSTVAEFIQKASIKGFIVIFIDNLPEGISDVADKDHASLLLEGLKDCRTIALNQLADFLRKQGICEIQLSTEQPYLRYYHYKRDGIDLFMFFNEHPYSELEAQVKIPIKGKAYIYDAFSNKILNLYVETDDNFTMLSLKLSAYESVIILFDDVDKEYVEEINKAQEEARHIEIYEELPINGAWQLFLAGAAEYPIFTYQREIDMLIDISAPGCFKNFSGTMRYETTIVLDVPGRKWILDLGKVYEIAEVWINEQHAGVKICPPYSFEITGLLKLGINTIRIDVTNTLAMEQKDPLSRCFALEPSGLMGPVVLKHCYTGNGIKSVKEEEL